MSNIEVRRTEEENAFISKIMGESFFETSTYDELTEAIRIDATREQNTRLLERFDKLCDESGLKYFVYEDTLQGVLAYKDFIPGAFELRVGMLRKDYDKFLKIVDGFTAEQKKKYQFSIQRKIGDSKADRIYPRIVSDKSVAVYHDGELIHDVGSLPMIACGYFDLAVFDNIPVDFFTRKRYFRRMKRRNDLYKASLLARGLEIEPYDYLGTKVNRLHRVVPIKVSGRSMHRLPKKYKNRKTEHVVRLAGWRSPMVPIEDLGEFPKMQFRDIMVRCPQNPGVWGGEPVYEASEELKRLQNDAKDIVVEIDRVCAELGIGYFACGGTMLGNVRHGGFIPWDDDIDIGMLRKDYEVFRARANEFMDKERFFLQTRETDPNIPYLFSKVRMNGTEYLTNYNIKRDFHKGICVDVFPFDYIPNPGTELVEFHGEVKAAARAHHRVVNRQYPEYYEKSTPDKKNLDWLLGQAAGRILARKYWGISLDKTQADYDKVVQKYDSVAAKKKLSYVACFIPGFTMAKVEDLMPFQRIQFDGITINIPANPERFLRMQYGDFMVQPYPHQRAGHDLLLWSDADGVGGGRQAGDK